MKVQKKTFERWVNSHLSKRQLEVVDLFQDFRDGVRLCFLMEVLSHESVGRVNKFPRHYQHKIENCTLAIRKIVSDGVKLVNIGPEDIEGGNEKLTLGLIWSIILRYQISTMINDSSGKSPLQWLLEWLQEKLKPKGLRPKNLTKDWNDGIMLPALVDAVAPGLFPDWDAVSKDQPLQNISQAMHIAKDWLGVPILITPEDMASPNVDEKSMMTYLYQFVSCALASGAPIGQHKALNAGNVRVYGPALEGDVPVNTETRFFVDATKAGSGTVGLSFGGPAQPKVNVISKPGEPQEVVITTTKAGDYDVVIQFDNKEIPHSPVRIHVVPEDPDATKVVVKNLGPNCDIGQVNSFQVDGSKAGGSGYLEVGILGPSMPANQIFVEHTGDSKFECKFVVVERGTFLCNIKWHGEHVPGSPFEVVGKKK